MHRNRLLSLVLVLLIVVLAAGLGWLAGTTIQSPAEAAARTAPPTPSLIFVPVEERVLTSAIVTRGTARYGLPQGIGLAPSLLKATSGTITTLPTRGAQLQEGDVLLTASGRPVFVLQGKIPVYRDLVPGLSGDDVEQFEQALQRLGFDPVSVDENYDAETSKAVAAWYKAAGWQPFAASAAQQAILHTLEQELAVAMNQQASTADIAAAAPKAVAAASADAALVNNLAATELADKRVAYAKVLADSTTSAGALLVSRAALSTAQTAVLAAQLKGEVAIQAAIDAQQVAEREANLATARAKSLAEELELVRRQADVQMPADEFVFLSELPVRVEQVAVNVGDPAVGPLLTVSNNQLAIDSSLPLGEAPLVIPGMAVAIDEPDLGIKATGVVVRVADTPGTDGADGFHIYFETEVDETPGKIEGFSLRLTIPVKSTGGAVMTVPLSALSLVADGTTRVQVDNQGALAFVTVKPGLAANGFVEVTALEGTLVPGQLVLVGYENPEE